MASSDKEGGYDYKFVSEPDDALKCLICLVVAKDPLQHEACGKLFCKECIEKYGKDKPCPNCKKSGSHFYVDHKSKREIQSLCVKCDNVDRKCEWVGTVATLEKHVSTCKFTLLPCPKRCKDKVKHFMRKDLDEHLKKDCPNRDYTCEYCAEKGTYVTITQVHDKICIKKILPCLSTGCPRTMQRQELVKHVNTECEYAVISCKYAILGCMETLARKNMAAHEEDDSLHPHLALDNISSVKATLKTGEPIKFKLTGYQKKKDNNVFVTSPSYYIYPNGYHMTIRVDTNGNGDGKGTHVSVYAPILKGNYDAELKWPLLGKVTFTLLNQLEDDNHYSDTIHFTIASNALVGDAWGSPQFIPHSELVKNTQYLKDDTLYFRMLVEVADHKPWQTNNVTGI